MSFSSYFPPDGHTKSRENNESGTQFGLSGLGIINPQERLKVLSDYGNAVEIDNNIPPRRYYRSGLEMVRMANVYLEEGSLENAFILYMKFMTLFLEKIRVHPDYSKVSVTDRAVNAAKLREVLPKAEQLKQRLLVQYHQEHQQYLKEEKLRDEKRERGAREAEEKGTNQQDPLPSRAPIITFPASGTSPSSSASFYTKVGLRDVMVPSKVMEGFLRLAKRNTDCNIETCAILAGILNHDQLVITHLLVPEQCGTPDSCITSDEEDIFAFQDEHNLITLGWIHTHPTQTAFLSSVDLHTHAGYQLMMPEALAIVCAPKFDTNECFTLTPQHGLPLVSRCHQVGFHPHPTDPPLFMRAEHARIDGDANVHIVDLRKNR